MPVTNELFIERLKDAGAIILGKTQTSEFAMTTRTVTSIAGEAVNPWDPSRISGASSGGSGASVAAGMSPFSIGSDGGGSTRIPSHHNGVVGFFPSPGRIPEQLPELFKTASPGPIMNQT